MAGEEQSWLERLDAELWSGGRLTGDAVLASDTTIKRQKPSHDGANLFMRVGRLTRWVMTVNCKTAVSGPRFSTPLVRPLTLTRSEGLKRSLTPRVSPSTFPRLDLRRCLG